MTSTQVYQLFIKAEPEEVFRAIIDPAFTRRYFYGSAFSEPPLPGRPYLSALPDGSAAVDGTIEVFDPPHRLVQTWHVRYDPAMTAEPPSRVEWTLARAGDGLTRLRVGDGPGPQPAHRGERPQWLGLGARRAQDPRRNRYAAAAGRPRRRGGGWRGCGGRTD